MRGSEVLVCWTDGAWHLTVSRSGLLTGRGFWRRSVDWLVGWLRVYVEFRLWVVGGQ